MTSNATIDPQILAAVHDINRKDAKSLADAKDRYREARSVVACLDNLLESTRATGDPEAVQRVSREVTAAAADLKDARVSLLVLRWRTVSASREMYRQLFILTSAEVKAIEKDLRHFAPEQLTELAA
jgi:hypothetical protein